MAEGSSLALGQIGRLFENLVESLYTTGSGGRLFTYLPELDSWGVDRAITLDGGAPLFLQVKALQHRSAQGQLTFHTDESTTSDHDRWVLILVHGTPEALEDIYVLTGPEWLRVASHTTSIRGVSVLEASIVPNSQAWERFSVEPARLGQRLMELAGTPLAMKSALKRQSFTPVGAYFERALITAIFGATDRLAPYRPAVDFAGRDLLVQLAKTPAHLFVQVKGSRKEHSPNRVEVEVHKNTFTNDSRVVFVFQYAPAGRAIDPVWVTDATELVARCPNQGAASINFNAALAGPDPVWGDRRMALEDVPLYLLNRISDTRLLA